MSATPDLNEIAATLRLFVAPGDIGEIRVIGPANAELSAKKGVA